MTSTKYIHTRLLRFVLILLLIMSCVPIMQGQTKQLLTWQNNLDYLQNFPDSDLEEQKDVVEQIRTGVELWLQLYPEENVELADAPPQPWSVGQIKSEISTLKETVELLLKQESLRPFELGITEITVTSELSPLSPVADSIDNMEIENRHATNVTESFQYLPGVNIDYKPSRNQTGIMIRGFDTRQVGWYLDNMPVYIPYDGFADMGRFLTGNLAEIQVAKGYSSPLLGPSGLGGAINIVTRQPEKKLEGQMVIGTGSGEMVESGIHVGSRFDRFLFQGGMDWLQTDYYPLSGNFNFEDDFYNTQSNYKRTNSFQRDADFDGRVGFLPNKRDRYIFSFMGQRGENAAPPYSGWDEGINPKYWRWPYWDKESYYINTNKGLGNQSDLQVRLFYDLYSNRLDEFGDNTFSTLNVFTLNDDHSLGGSADFSTHASSHHSISASVFFKDDTHTQSETDLTRNPQAKPSVTHRDRLFSFGLQDSIAVTGRFHVIAGFSVDHMDGVKAQDFIETYTGRGSSRVYTYTIAPFECAHSTSYSSFPGCIDVWSFNPLVSASYSLSKSGTLFVTFAKKSHFPTMKDRYDYKNGKAIPNPTLESENTRNWSIGYSHAFPFKTMAQVELFRSDVDDAIEKTFISDPTGETCPNSDRDGFCQQSVNVGKELHQGVEILIRSNGFSHVSLDMHYSYLSRSISGPEDMPQVYPTGTPKHKTVGTATILLPRDILLLATARYEHGNIGDFFLDEENFVQLIPASNFATADLGGIFPIFGFKGAKVQIGAKNIFDRNYYYREGYPMAGRNWYLNMKYQF
jgi:iron complex outermembrane receptor protein